MLMETTVFTPRSMYIKLTTLGLAVVFDSLAPFLVSMVVSSARLAVFIDGQGRRTPVLRRLPGVATRTLLPRLPLIAVFSPCSALKRKLTGCLLTV